MEFPEMAVTQIVGNKTIGIPGVSSWTTIEWRANAFWFLIVDFY